MTNYRSPWWLIDPCFYDAAFLYLFKHALVQDAAYSTLLRGARQTLHTRIAAVLEQHFADIGQAQPDVWPLRSYVSSVRLCNGATSRSV